CSARGYDDPKKTFPSRERWKGIEIHRIATLGLGRKRKWLRIADFAAFLIGCATRVMALPKQDLVIAMTVPPLISIVGALAVRFKGGKLLYWVMDLNPDEAIAAGWLKPRSLMAKGLEVASRYSMKVASQIVVLDRFMEERIAAKGLPREKICVLPPWSLA